MRLPYLASFAIFWALAEGTCPRSHRFAFSAGVKCCKYGFEGNRPELGAGCDGGRIKEDSTCCDRDDFIDCPTGNCLEQETTKACPSTHPYAFQSGRSCCGSERSGAECRASSFALLLSSSCCENNDQVPCPGGKDNCRSANRHLCYLAGELLVGVVEKSFCLNLPVTLGRPDDLVEFLLEDLTNGGEEAEVVESCHREGAAGKEDCAQINFVSGGGRGRFGSATAGAGRAPHSRPPRHRRCNRGGYRWRSTGSGRLRCVRAG